MTRRPNRRRLERIALAAALAFSGCGQLTPTGLDAERAAGVEKPAEATDTEQTIPDVVWIKRDTLDQVRSIGRPTLRDREESHTSTGPNRKSGDKKRR